MYFTGATKKTFRFMRGTLQLVFSTDYHSFFCVGSVDNLCMFLMLLNPF